MHPSQHPSQAPSQARSVAQGAPGYVVKEKAVTKPVVILQQRVVPHAKSVIDEKTYNIGPIATDELHQLNGQVHAYSYVDKSERTLKAVQLDVVMYMRIPQVHEEEKRGSYVEVPAGVDIDSYLPHMSNETLQLVLLESYLSRN
ncbi:MAG: hypothetical protein KVP17_000410 [Porospora cf. gigantea B]|uniref:uncharacterized protein n=1 Tax=Porospora cf. gigantea B TaxID=2853592 RepID=UPI0035719055|nr:MAG: hypothetical protein KVP17_000410 [Porospora cf. gigantea B]